MTAETTAREKSPETPAAPPEKHLRPGRGKKREKKRASLPKVILFLGMVLLVGLIAARVVIHFMLRPEAIVERLERDYNLRAEVKDTTLSLFSFPAKLEIKGLVLAPRDKDADNATPLDSRSPIMNPVLAIDTVILEQGLTDLLFGTLDVRRLRGEKFKLEFRMEEDGSHTLEGMFDKPEIVASKPNPKYQSDGAKDGKGGKGTGAPDEEKKKEKKARGLMADSLPLNTRIDEFSLSDGEIVVHLRKKDSKLHFRNVDLSLNGIEIHPDDLGKGNTGKLNISGDLTIQKDDETETYAQLDVVSAGNVLFFEKASGKFNPIVDADLTLQEGSSIDNVPTIKRLYEKLSPLANFGIHLKEVNLEGMLQKDAVAKIRYFENKVTFEDTPRMQMSDYTLDIFQGAWLQMDENTHFVESEVRVSEAHTARTLDGVFKFLGGTIGKLLPDDTKARAEKYLLHDDRLAVVFTSTEMLSRPTVKVLKPDGDDLLKASGIDDLINNLKNLLDDKDTRDQLKDALKDLFK